MFSLSYVSKKYNVDIALKLAYVYVCCTLLLVMPYHNMKMHVALLSFMGDVNSLTGDMRYHANT